MDGAEIYRLPFRITLESLLLVVLILVARRAWADEPKVSFNLPADEFPKAILEFYHQSKIEVLFLANDTLSQIKTRPVTGEFVPSEALGRMLKGTGLTFRFVTEHSVTIKQPDPVTAAVPGQAIPPEKKSLWQKLWDEGIALIEKLTRPMDEVLIATNRTQAIAGTEGEPVLSFNRQYIDSTGAFSLPEVLATVPQIFGGGPQEYAESGPEAATNASLAAGVNVRGIGARQALVTLDGMRLPGSGTKAEFPDVSMLPLAAIDGFNVIADGPSTLYGADAVSGVVNIVSREIDGAETQARVGEATSGSPGEREISQLFGTRWTGGNAGIALEYYDRGALGAAGHPQATSNFQPWNAGTLDTLYGYPGNMSIGSTTWPVLSTSNGRPVLGTPGSPRLYDQWSGRDILPWRERLSALAHLSMTLDSLRIWGHLWISSRHATEETSSGDPANIALPSTNPGYVNPLGGSSSVNLAYTFGTLLGPATEDDNVLSGSIAAGAEADLGNWVLSATIMTAAERETENNGGFVNGTALTQAVDSTNPVQVFDPFASPDQINASTLTSLRETLSYESHARTSEFMLSARRALPVTPEKVAEVTVGEDYREESLISIAVPETLSAENANRSIAAGFAQISIPFIGASDEVPFARALDMTLGERYEHYFGTGDAWSPKVAAAWTIIPDLTVRGTWGRSFAPPALTDQSQVGNFSVTEQLPSGQRVLLESGGNPYLNPETARTFTFGADAGWDSGLAVSLTYFNILSVGRVIQPTFSGTLAGFDGVIILNPTLAERANVCIHSLFHGGATATCEAPVDDILDAREQNLQLLKTSGIDTSGKYVHGNWNIRLDTTYLLQYSQKNATLGLQDLLGTPNYPVNFRGRMSVARALPQTTVIAALNYANSYNDNEVTPARRVGSWTTVDLQLRYHPSEQSRIHGMELSVGVLNLTDRRPPFVEDTQVAAAWDTANGGNLIGRTVNAGIRCQW
jgi:iron complex outermembrane recepter protein